MAILLFSFDSVANWGNSGVTAGDQNGVALNTTNKVYGTGSMDMKVDVSASAYDRAYFINTTDSKDLSSVSGTGYIRFWLYIPSATYFNNFSISFGSDVSNRYYKSVYNDAYGVSLHSGWNLVDFLWSSMSELGSPNDAALDWWHLGIEYDSGQADATFIIDNLSQSDTPLPRVKVIAVT